MLSTVGSFKVSIGWPGADTSQDTRFTQFVNAADAALKQYVKRQLEAGNYVHYPFRLGGESIVLPETPVLSYRLTGTVTSGQPTITGLSSTSSLFAGMPVVVLQNASSPTTQPFPNGATVQSIDSLSQVTLTGTASYSASGVPIIFGLSMWLDPAGAFGDGPGSDPSGPFGPVNLLYPGIDYALQRDQPDGTSKSGKVVRLGSVLGTFGMAAGWGAYGSSWGGIQTRGTLSGSLPPLWGKWPPGSLRIVYSAGFSPANIPADLVAAENALAAWMWNAADRGLIQVQSESFNGYSLSVASAVDALKTAPELGSTRQLLSRWRRVSI